MRKLLVVLSIVGAATIWPFMTVSFEEVGDRPSRHLEVEVWLNKHNGTVYEAGQYVRVYFQASEDCYVAIYNVDTDGFINVLYPKYNDNAGVEGGRIYEIPDPYDDYDLIVDGRKGIEYVVAVASYFPLNLRSLYDLEEGVDYDIYWPGGHITGDPHLAIYEINQQLAWGDDEYEPEGYASDVSWFYVRQWVPYPRYIVYHWYPDYYWDQWWDPYVHVHIWTDFYWDHYWCRPWWWCHGCRPIYVYWYIDRDSGRRCTWKGQYHQDRRKPDWYREKPVRRGGEGRPSRSKDDKDQIAWEDKRRPSRGGSSQPGEVMKERTGWEKAITSTRRSRQEDQQSNRDRAKSELQSRQSPSRMDRGEVIKRRSRTQISRSTESRKSTNKTAIQGKSPARSETKKVKRSSGRSSSLGKIIGSVTKLFGGDSKKEKSGAQKKSSDTGSQKERSSKNQSSSKSTSSERTSRRDN